MQTADEFEVLEEAIAAAHAQSRWALFVYKREGSICKLRCFATKHKESCKYHLNLRAKDGIYRVTSVDLNHTCKVHYPRKRQVKSNLITRSSTVVEGFRCRGSGDAKALQVELQEKERLSVSYIQAYNITQGIANGYIQFWNQMARLPGYIAAARVGDPGGTYELDISSGSRFESVYIASSFSRKFWQHSRRIAVMDGTHMKHIFGGVLLTSCVKDADNHSVMMALAYVYTENQEHWTSFLHRWQDDFPDTKLVFSDKDKGLWSAVDSVGIPHAICVQHLIKNVKKEYPGSGVLQDGIHKLARAASVTEAASILSKMREEFPKCKEALSYLEDRGPEFMAFHFVSRGIGRLNDITSNTAEVKNRSLAEARTMPVISMINRIFRTEVELATKWRSAAASCEDDVTDAASQCLLKRLDKSRDMTVAVLSASAEQLCANIIKDDMHSYKVTLTRHGACTCRCMKHCDRGFLCDHAVRLLDAVQGRTDLGSSWAMLNLRWFNEAYTVRQWRLQYAVELTAPACVVDEIPDGGILPWAVVPKGKGRPKKRRIRAPRPDADGQPAVKKVRRCGACSEVGHNRKTCRRVQTDILKKTIQGSK
jgi:hypothetical protein